MHFSGGAHVHPGLNYILGMIVYDSLLSLSLFGIGKSIINSGSISTIGLVVDLIAAKDLQKNILRKQRLSCAKAKELWIRFDQRREPNLAWRCDRLFGVLAVEGLSQPFCFKDTSKKWTQVRQRDRSRERTNK